MEDDFPDDDNGFVLRDMRSKGLNLSDPRDVDFSIIFPREKSAKQFIDEIRDAFDQVEYHRSETRRTLVWDVTATKLMIPTHQALTETEAFLQGKAEPFGGRNDGWGFWEV